MAADGEMRGNLRVHWGRNQDPDMTMNVNSWESAEILEKALDRFHVKFEVEDWGNFIKISKGRMSWAWYVLYIIYEEK